MFRNRHFCYGQNIFCLIIYFTWAGDSHRHATGSTDEKRISGRIYQAAGRRPRHSRLRLAGLLRNGQCRARAPLC